MVISNRPRISLLSPGLALLLYPFPPALYNPVPPLVPPGLDPVPVPAPAPVGLVLALAAVPPAMTACGDWVFFPAQPCQHTVLALVVWVLIAGAGDELVACSSNPAAESFSEGRP